MKYIDLFAGIGGFHYGIDRACAKAPGLETGGKTTSVLQEHLSDLPSQHGGYGTITCVYSNEWDKYANSVYRRHYGECDNRDIRTVEASEIPDFDLLCGGFPCQAFSVAGKRGGFDDTRGTLFFEVARILKEKQPRLLVLENVKGLLSHDSGRTFKVILATLTELGYDVQWQVLNSKNFGVPQNRERVYIVGHLRGTPRPQVFPITGTNQKDIIVSGVLDTETWKKRFEQIRRVHSPDGICPTIPTGTGGGVMTKIDLRQPKIFSDTSGRKKNQNGKGWREGESFTLNTIDRQGIITRTVRSGGKNSPYGSKQSWDKYLVDGVIRRLTPTECARLQGFPDDWCSELSDTQQYKCYGNAVTTNVVTEVIRRLL